MQQHIHLAGQPEAVADRVFVRQASWHFPFVALLVAFSWRLLLILVAERMMCSRSWQRR
jgi:hypothetical protein